MVWGSEEGPARSWTGLCSAWRGSGHPPPSPSGKTKPIVRLLGLIPQRVLGPRQEEGITHLPLNLVSWCRVHTQKQEAGATGSDCRMAHLEHLGAGLCPHWDMGP